MGCSLTIPHQAGHRAPRGRRVIPSLVRVTLSRNGEQSLKRGQLVEVDLESPSRIVAVNQSTV